MLTPMSGRSGMRDDDQSKLQLRSFLRDPNDTRVDTRVGYEPTRLVGIEG